MVERPYYRNSRRDIMSDGSEMLGIWSKRMAPNFTAIVQQDGEWWIGWIEEVPGVNSQGKTRVELLDNLRDALDEVLEMNRADASSAFIP